MIAWPHDTNSTHTPARGARTGPSWGSYSNIARYRATQGSIVVQCQWLLPATDSLIDPNLVTNIDKGAQPPA